MKQSKKTLVLLLALTSALAIAPLSALTASAGEKRTVFLDEQFEGTSFSSSKWDVANKGDSIVLGSDVETGHLTTKYNVENLVVGTAEKIKKLQSLQFDFQAVEEKWNAIFFSASNEFSVKTDGSNTFEQTDNFSSYGAQMFLYAPMPNKGVDPKIQSGLDVEGFNVPYEFKADGWYTLKIEPINATEAKLYVADKETGIPSGAEAITTIKLTTNKYSFDDLYVFMGCEGGGALTIDNFSVVSENLNFSENFNDPSLDAGFAKYATNKNISYEIVEANVYALFDNSKAGDSLIFNHPIPVETSIVKDLNCLDITFNATYAKNSTSKLAFAFGMASKDIKDGCYMCIVEGKNLAIYRYENGQLTALTEKANIKGLDSKDGAVLRIVANKKGMVSVYRMVEVTDRGRTVQEGQFITSAAIDAQDYYAGYFGFVTPENNAEDIRLDDLKVCTSTYRVPVTKSVTHNFSNDYFGNKGYEDFLTNETGGKFSVDTKNGKLCFEGLSDYSFFGSAYEYDDFVLDFKISSIKVSGDDDATKDFTSTANAKWFGIDIGKQVRTDGDYGSNVTLMFDITRPRGMSQDNWGATAVSAYSGSGKLPEGYTTVYQAPIPAEYFKAIQYGETQNEEDIAEGDAVCVRVVADKGTLKLYMKKASDLGFTLYYEASGVDTTGYTALCCTGYTTLKIDDFSMANISDLYICADHYAPEKQYVENKVVIYDNNNPTDVNGLKETELNSAGCGSVLSASYAILPLTVVGVALAKKKRKDGND